MPDLQDDGTGAIFDSLDLGLIVLDRELRIVTWNAWIASASGIPAAAASGRRLPELFPDAALGRLTSAASQALESGTSSILTHSLRSALLPLKTRAGRILAHNIAVRAVSDRASDRCLLQITD